MILLQKILPEYSYQAKAVNSGILIAAPSSNTNIVDPAIWGYELTSLDGFWRITS